MRSAGCANSAQELDTFTLAQFKEAMQGIGVRAKVVNDLIRVSPTPSTDEPFTLVDDALPVVSPAQGFSDDLALVTITLRERTQG